MLANNKTLQSLDLSRNSIKDEGAEALANNKTLQWLSLIWNDITDKGAIAILKNPYLREAWISNSLLPLISDKILTISSIDNPVERRRQLARFDNPTLTLQEICFFSIAQNRTSTKDLPEVIDNQIRSYFIP